MQVIGVHEFGGPEVLRAIELPDPHAGAGHIRVAVRAAAINPADVMLRDGRLAEWVGDATPPFVPGMDFSGVIDEVGPDVDPAFDLKVGDSVVGIIDNRGARGAYSQYVVVDAHSVAPKPQQLTFEEASSFLMNALTARAALDALDLPAGASLVVTGAAGAFGAATVELAAASGIRVAAIAAAQDRDFLQMIGARTVIDRDADVLGALEAFSPNGVDAVADGALLKERIYPAIRDGGQVAAVIGGGPYPGRGITVHDVNVRARVTDRAAIADLAERASDGRLTTRVSEIYPMARAAEAHHRFAAGGLRGRLVVQF